ncbi:hypothetical protein SAMN05216243_1240 [Sediminibacillus albus]|uniref:Uncharacterized protein n=1 Tax=Sediminibacillus albus TaxID=407036 RepID=A0A1G8X9V3_9BACI|nr:hypothetical protein SAMN05216243_1240 [Sediminibacillus albus]
MLDRQLFMNVSQYGELYEMVAPKDDDVIDRVAHSVVKRLKNKNLLDLLIGKTVEVVLEIRRKAVCVKLNSTQTAFLKFYLS